MKLPMIATLSLLNLVTFGCGRQEVTPAGAATTAAPSPIQENASNDWSLMVPNTANLPSCDAGGEGRLAYVKAQSSFMTCTAGTWQPVDLRNGTIPAPVSGRDGANSLVLVSDEPAGTNCQHGGKKLITGIDADNDGKLSAEETKNIQFLCKDAPGLRIRNVWSFQDTNIETSDPDISLSSLVLTTKIGEIQLTKFDDGSSFLSVGGTIRSYDSRTDLYVETFAESFFIPQSNGTINLSKKIMTSSYMLNHRINFDSNPPQISLGVLYNGQVFYRDYSLSPVQ